MLDRRGWWRAAGALALAGLTGSVAAQAPAAAAPVKVGYVYVSPIGDAGWTFQHDQGRKQMEAALGGKVQSKYVENVAEGPDAERVIREMAQSGNDIIFTTSFGYMNPTEKVAKQFPKVKFAHATGYKTGPNFANYNARFYEGRYLTGVIAGKMTKTNILGYVAAFPIPEVLQGINAFARGARSVNPKAEVRVIWVNSWYDPGKEREAALTLLSQNADVVTHHTDSTAVVQAAEEKGKYAFGYHSDMSKYGPKAHLTATTHQWGDYYTQGRAGGAGRQLEADRDLGRLQGRHDQAGAAQRRDTRRREGAIVKLEGDLKAGKFHPFAGPVKDQDGKERVAAGKTMTDDELGKMDYYVEGVGSKLPKK